MWLLVPWITGRKIPAKELVELVEWLGLVEKFSNSFHFKFGCFGKICFVKTNP